jgi:hypothetical protein
MPDPMSPVSHRELSWPDQPSDREDFRATIERRVDERAYGVCAQPRSIIGAALCDDPLALSNVCRRAEPGSVDETLCDDAALQKAQKWLADIAEKALQLVLGAKMGRSK